MTAQEIFNTTAIKEIEISILNIYYDIEIGKHHWYREKETICQLLKIRKQILDSMFVINENYKVLLTDFNEAMTLQLINMRKRTISIYESVSKIKQSSYIEGKCFLGYEYSKIHPVQTIRAKKIWALLSGSLDDYMPLYYDNGVNHGFSIYTENPNIESENELLYLSKEKNNWNEGLNREITKDMHLTYAFHNLFRHLDFSIYDLLWVRDFNIEIHVEHNYDTYQNNEHDDDLHWDECDYFD